MNKVERFGTHVSAEHDWQQAFEKKAAKRIAAAASVEGDEDEEEDKEEEVKVKKPEESALAALPRVISDDRTISSC